VKKNFGIIVLTFLLLGCGENSDGSDKSTYSSCSITSSNALLSSDRATDVSQCWDGVNYREKNLAMDWCGKLVNNYMSRYSDGHGIKYKVASTNCPEIHYNSPSSESGTSSSTSENLNYSIKVTLESLKANGNNWDAFGGNPDIEVYIGGKYQKLCKDSFSCTLQYASTQNTLDFKIYDKDISSDDFVGKGLCHVNDTCQLGQALVEINRI